VNLVRDGDPLTIAHPDTNIVPTAPCPFKLHTLERRRNKTNKL
jgi:hypothetical protein